MHNEASFHPFEVDKTTYYSSHFQRASKEYKNVLRCAHNGFDMASKIANAKCVKFPMQRGCWFWRFWWHWMTVPFRHNPTAFGLQERNIEESLDVLLVSQSLGQEKRDNLTANFNADVWVTTDNSSLSERKIDVGHTNLCKISHCFINFGLPIRTKKPMRVVNTTEPMEPRRRIQISERRGCGRPEHETLSQNGYGLCLIAKASTLFNKSQLPMHQRQARGYMPFCTHKRIWRPSAVVILEFALSFHDQKSTHISSLGLRN